MEQRLVQKQVQKMLFSQKMQESMYILQMPIVDLKNLIENELESNPLLEEDIKPAPPSLKTHPKAEARELRATRPLSLQESLRRQLTIFVPEGYIDIGEEIIGNIDDDGYLSITLEEIAASLNKDISSVKAVAYMVQSFDPIGVAASSLRECLLIQLRAKGRENTLPWKIVENHLEECGKKQYAKIARSLNTSIDEVTQAVSEISRLEPKPGRKYSNKAEAQYIVPDIYVKKIDDEYQILTNQFDIPAVRVNTFYNNLLRDKKSDEATQDYIREKMRSANFLIKCIRQRWETMRKICDFLIKEQGECMEKGRCFLKPLTFKAAAEAIGRHESTISRAIANKYIDTPAGIFEMREFFSGRISNGTAKHPGGPEEKSGHSATSVKMELKAMIDEEDKKKPLSDQKLKKMFDEKNIRLSRRTIAKYREEMKILPSYLRKN